MCKVFDTAEGNYLATLFNPFSTFRQFEEDWGTTSRFFGHKSSELNPGHGDEDWDSDDELEINTTPWAYLAAATAMLTDVSRDPADEDLTALLQRRCGTSLSTLYPHRPLELDAEEPWDWAGVAGTWHVKATQRFVIDLRCGGFTSVALPPLSLLAAGRSAVEQECTAFGIKDYLWTGISLPTEAYLLPHIFCHGTCAAEALLVLNTKVSLRGTRARNQTDGPVTSDDVDGLTAFVYRVVYLDSGSAPASLTDSGAVTGAPPQVKYMLVIILKDPTKRSIFRGVEAWGPRSTAGVFGVSTCSHVAWSLTRRPSPLNG